MVVSRVLIPEYIEIQQRSKRVRKRENGGIKKKRVKREREGGREKRKKEGRGRNCSYNLGIFTTLISNIYVST